MIILGYRYFEPRNRRAGRAVTIMAPFISLLVPSSVGGSKIRFSSLFEPNSQKVKAGFGFCRIRSPGEGIWQGSGWTLPSPPKVFS